MKPVVICGGNLALCCHVQILDEVERRRGVSAALVYPFMRSLMESPFPAPGKIIKVKTFLPGAGNEVRAPPLTAFCLQLCEILSVNWTHRSQFKCVNVMCEFIFRSSSWGGPQTPDWSMWTSIVFSVVSVCGRWYESLPRCCWSVGSSSWLINSGEAPCSS